MDWTSRTGAGAGPPTDRALARACELVRESAHIVAFTGAGISAESGIPTYRDADESLWAKYDPEKVVQIDYFLVDPAPFWHFFLDVRYRAVTDARPNPGHTALAEMEAAGRLKAVITQNIDGLHQAAGSRRVIELHGNTRSIACLRCHARYSMEEVYQQLQKELPPPCRQCGGMLKPEVVFYGEALPELALADAAAEIMDCDLLIAIGSSLRVYPAAALPEQAKAAGARLIIVNKTSTPYDHLADGLLRGSSGEVLPAIAAAALGRTT
jgi:NAD-dependent deacetylase